MKAKKCKTGGQANTNSKVTASKTATKYTGGKNAKVTAKKKY